MTSRRSRRADRLAAAFALAVVVLLAGCSSDDGDPEIVVSSAVVALPAGANTALYLTIENVGLGDDHLVSVASEVGEPLELHETVAGDDGLMRMVALDDVALPAGTTVRFEPGGLHVMILGAPPLEEGDVVQFELDFDRSPSQQIEAVVRPYTDLFDE